MSNIYDIHQKAFRGVAAYVVLDDSDGQLVARVAFTFSKSGLRTTCYFHILGEQMQRANADGGGYDKQSASAGFAVDRIAKAVGKASDKLHIIARMRAALKDDGQYWDHALSAAGFRVIQAV